MEESRESWPGGADNTSCVGKIFYALSKSLDLYYYDFDSQTRNKYNSEIVA